MKDLLKHLFYPVILPLIIVAFLYSGLWGYAYYTATSKLSETTQKLQDNHLTLRHDPLRITGFPGEFSATVSNVELFQSGNSDTLKIPQISIRFWPLPGRKATLNIPQATLYDRDIEQDIATISKITLKSHLPVLPIFQTQNTFDVSPLSFHLYGMDVFVNGTVSVDDMDKVDGALSAKLVNFEPFLDRLRSTLDIPRNLSIGLMALTILSQKENGVSYLNLPITITDNHLKIGTFDLGEIQLPLSAE